jgi:hypothetical protein
LHHVTQTSSSIVISDSADKGDRGAGTRRRNGLVETLAARDLVEVRPGDGFTGSGVSCRSSDEVEVQAPDDDDVEHGARLDET